MSLALQSRQRGFIMNFENGSEMTRYLLVSWLWERVR